MNEAQETTYGNDHMLSPINLNSYLRQHKKNISIGSNNGMIFTLGNAEPEENIDEEEK